MSVDLLVPNEFVLAEGPRWDGANGRLLWVDIERGELHTWDGAHAPTIAPSCVHVCVPSQLWSSPRSMSTQSSRFPAASQRGPSASRNSSGTRRSTLTPEA